jgi:hypothetical protein
MRKDLRVRNISLCYIIYAMSVINGEGAGIAQSVWRLATGWMTEGLEFGSLYGQEFSVLHVVQTGSGVHPTSYPMGNGGSFLGGKAAEA